MPGHCHQCRTAIGLDRPGRRDACLHCGADLRCCRNCRFYEPGQHNDCREPQAERQVEKEQGNFCDYFVLRDSPSAEAQPSDARSRLAALFSKGRT